MYGLLVTHAVQIFNIPKEELIPLHKILLAFEVRNFD